MLWNPSIACQTSALRAAQHAVMEQYHQRVKLLVLIMTKLTWNSINLFTNLQVAAVSGDARRALDICRRATELAQAELTSEGGGQVGMQHVDRAIHEMFCSAKVMAVRCASFHEKMFLRGVLAEFRRNGLEEAVFKQVSRIAFVFLSVM